MKILDAIIAFLNVGFFLLTWKAKKDDENKAAKEALSIEAKDAIKKGDISGILAVYDKLHQL